MITRVAHVRCKSAARLMVLIFLAAFVACEKKAAKNQSISEVPPTVVFTVPDGFRGIIRLREDDTLDGSELEIDVSPEGDASIGNRDILRGPHRMVARTESGKIIESAHGEESPRDEQIRFHLLGSEAACEWYLVGDEADLRRAHKDGLPSSSGPLDVSDTPTVVFAFPCELHGMFAVQVAANLSSDETALTSVSDNEFRLSVGENGVAMVSSLDVIEATHRSRVEFGGQLDPSVFIVALTHRIDASGHPVAYFFVGDKSPQIDASTDFQPNLAPPRRGIDR